MKQQIITPDLNDKTQCFLVEAENYLKLYQPLFRPASLLVRRYFHRGVCQKYSGAPVVIWMAYLPD
jgi:hypothetical protein